MRLLKIWNLSLIALSLMGALGAYIVQDIWLQNKINISEILTHILFILVTVNLGYRLFGFVKPIYLSRSEFSNSALISFYLASIVIYIFTSYIFSISNILFSGILIYANHLLYLRYRRRYILLLGALIIGYKGARLPIIYMLFPLLLLDRNRISIIVFLSAFILAVGVSRGKDSIDLISLGSVFGVEWRDYFLMYDDNLHLNHKGAMHYITEIFVLPIPGHSLFIDTWDIRLGSLPRLLANKLDLKETGLRLGLLNEIKLLFGYNSLFFVLLVLGGIIRLLEKAVNTYGTSALNISLTFVPLYCLIGQTDVLLTFVYPTLIFTLLAQGFFKSRSCA